MSVEEILAYAFDRFDENDYDGAIKAFMAAHHASTDEQQKVDIYGVIYENFIGPNEEEFRNNYEENIAYLRNNHLLFIDNIPDYSELSCQMVPVSDDRFYVWNKETNRFWGADTLDVSELSGEITREFDSIIIDGFSDMRLILSELRRKEYMNVYIILAEEELTGLFFSFLAASNMSERFMHNVSTFDNREKFLNYIYESGNYIPKTIKSLSKFDYSIKMSELHVRRVAEKKKTRPFLSIAIPTFNRGKIALENIKRLQSLMYDEEIEFCICNNSSTQTLEYYDNIREIANSDSRINYYERPSQRFRDSFENIMKLPEGEYIVFCSDEDFIIPENLALVLNEIINHREFGVACFGTVVNDEIAYYLLNEAFFIEPGVSALKSGLGCNYISGLCIRNGKETINSEIVDTMSALYRENEYYKTYPHCVYMASFAYHSGLRITNIPLFFDSTKGINKDSGYKDSDYVMGHILPESRIAQAEDQIKIVFDMNLSEIEIAEMIFYIISRIFELLRVAYKLYFEGMNKRHSWQETCEMINDFVEKVIYDLEENHISNLGLLDQLKKKYSVLYQNEKTRLVDSV